MEGVPGVGFEGTLDGEGLLYERDVILGTFEKVVLCKEMEHVAHL